jgi:hypothetical protein
MFLPERTHHANVMTRRQICIAATAVLAAGMSACRARDNNPPTQGQRMDKDRREVVYFDVSTFDYLSRPIFEIKLNGIEVGSGGGALMTGVAVPLGPQVVTWRLGGPEGMPDNGNTVKATNQPVLLRPDAKQRYLGVHVYPDNTVELVPHAFWPEKTARGEEINRQLEKKRGQ